MVVVFKRIYRAGRHLDAVDLYHSLLKQGVEPREAINVIPHNYELIQIEMMDLFSFLNIMAIRTCIHARPEVQEWAKAMLHEVGKVHDFKVYNPFKLHLGLT